MDQVWIPNWNVNKFLSSTSVLHLAKYWAKYVRIAITTSHDYISLYPLYGILWSFVLVWRIYVVLYWDVWSGSPAWPTRRAAATPSTNEKWNRIRNFEYQKVFNFFKIEKVQQNSIQGWLMDICLAVELSGPLYCVTKWILEIQQNYQIHVRSIDVTSFWSCPLHQLPQFWPVIYWGWSCLDWTTREIWHDVLKSINCGMQQRIQKKWYERTFRKTYANSP